MKNLLLECKLQLEYLNEKFGSTGTSNALIAKIEAATQEDKDEFLEDKQSGAIYSKTTNQDICVCYDDEYREMLLNLLNNQNEKA